MDGTGTQACFHTPYGMTMDYAGAIYVGDSGNNCIRKITVASANVETFAGSCGTTQPGWQDGVGTAALFNAPAGVAYDPTSNAILVADYKNNRIRSIDMATRMVTTLAGSDTAGYVDDYGTNAQFYNPTAVAPDGKGGVYTVEQGFANAGLLRHLDNFDGPRLVSTLAGLSGGTWLGGFSDGVGTAARFDGPRALAVDASGRQIWIAGELLRRLLHSAVRNTHACACRHRQRSHPIRAHTTAAAHAQPPSSDPSTAPAATAASIAFAAAPSSVAHASAAVAAPSGASQPASSGASASSPPSPSPAASSTTAAATTSSAAAPALPAATAAADPTRAAPGLLPAPPQAAGSIPA